MSTERKNAPIDVKVAVLTQAGYRCAVPTCRTILALDIHHIHELHKGGGDTIDNLVALCPTCHALYHRGTIKYESICAWKMLLVSINEVVGKRAFDDLILLEKQSIMGEIEFSGDALIHFGALIAANLIQYGQMTVTTGKGNEYRSYWVDLTDKGKEFLKCYRDADLLEAQRLFGAGF